MEKIATVQWKRTQKRNMKMIEEDAHGRQRRLNIRTSSSGVDGIGERKSSTGGKKLGGTQTSWHFAIHKAMEQCYDALI